MKQLLLLLTCSILFLPVRSQNLIGLKKQQIEKEVNVLFPTFVKDNSFVNSTYKYLKYIDKQNEQTLLVFLSENDVCSSTKLICDYSMLDQVKAEMKKYKSEGKDHWSYMAEGVKYTITLRRDEWFFSLLTSRKE